MTPPGKTDGIPIRPGPQDGDGYTHALVLSSHPQPAPAVDQRPGAAAIAPPAAGHRSSDPSQAAVDPTTFAREPRAVTVDGELTTYGEAQAEERHDHTWTAVDEWPADMDPEPYPEGSVI